MTTRSESRNKAGRRRIRQPADSGSLLAGRASQVRQVKLLFAHNTEQGLAATAALVNTAGRNGEHLRRCDVILAILRTRQLYWAGGQSRAAGPIAA